MMRFAVSLIGLAALLAVGACGGSTPTDVSESVDDNQPVPNEPSEPISGAPATVELESGGAQFLGTYERTAPLVVRVEDARGLRVPNAEVRWKLVKGSGVLLKVSSRDAPGPPAPGSTEIRTTSDDRGEAGAILESRDVAGAYVVEARVDGIVGPVRFTGNISQ